jgi:hypothetical protein
VILSAEVEIKAIQLTGSQYREISKIIQSALINTEARIRDYGQQRTWITNQYGREKPASVAARYDELGNNLDQDHKQLAAIRTFLS